MNPLFEGVSGARLKTAILFSVVLLGLFLLVQVVSGFSNLRYIGAGVTPANTITVSGEGELFAVADIAEFTFSVVSSKATVADAQADATKKINDITTYLKGAGVDVKDIKTTDYNVYPQYEYQTVVCPAGSYCPGGKQVLKGYEVRQSTSVKVRDTAKAGDLLTGVGSKGATEVSGLVFTFDDPSKIKNDVRSKAIADAKSKADTLASQLGVTLVRVVSFNENGSGVPSPIYYRDTAMGMGGSEVKAAAPEISTGQNKITSNVTVTYEIR